MKRSDPTRYLKSFGIGFVLGLGAGWRVHALGAAAEIADWIENKFQAEISAAKAAGRGLGVGNLVEASLAFARGPALPVTVGLTIAVVVAFGLLKEFFERATIDRIWPSYPDILDPKLERDNIARYRPLAAGTPFFERDQELEKLVRFAEDFSGPRVTFQFLTGREGVGKTRLALEWLKEMKARGWDAGILDQKAETAEIRSALLRNKTAVLIDEPGRIENFWGILDALLRKRKRVRIVLANQMALRRPNSLDDDARQRIANAQRGTLQLRGMTNDALQKLAPEMSDEQIEEAQGCPLMVLIKPHDFAEVERRVALREETAEEKNVGRILALAALAGPVARTEVDRALGVSVATSSIEPLFEDVDRTTLDAMLPAFAPDIFADQIMLRHAADHPGNIADFFEQAITLNSDAVAHRVASLWRRDQLDSRDIKLRTALTEALDAQAPAWGDRLRARAIELVVETTTPPVDARGRPDLTSLAEALDELSEIAAARPFEGYLRLCEAAGAVDAINHYGEAQQFDRLERWGARLIELCESEANRGDREFRILETKGAVAAMHRYGDAQQLDGLERWGVRLIAMCESEAFCGDRDIRLAEAVGAMSAIYCYGESKRFGDLERWGARLIALCESAAFCADREIRHLEALSAVAAMNRYGEARQFERLERWGSRLIGLCESQANCGDREFRVLEATSAGNAIYHYGEAGRFGDLERWGARLLALCESTAFCGDREIRLKEANGMINAMNLIR